MRTIKIAFITKLFSFFERLTSKPIIGGLYISDSMLQYVVLGSKPNAVSLKIPPGVVREGRIFDAKQFVTLLKQFHAMVDTSNGASIQVVVTLPPGSVYTQSFQIPNVGREKLEESGKLNLQMISPISEDKAYMSFQIVGETTDKFDLLGAIAEHKIVNDIDAALKEADFSPVIFEFPGLALARSVFYGIGASIKKEPSIIFQISSDGMNLSIIRNGELYFDYFRSWTSIQGNERQISRELFENVVTQEIQKVLNFSLSRFRENISRLFLIAPGFETQIQNFAQEKFGLTMTPFVISSWSLSPRWYVVFGSALRGALDRSRDTFITLSSISSSELFKEEQTINFIILWRNILAGVLAIFLVLYGGIAYFLAKESTNIKGQLVIFTTLGQQKDLDMFQKQATQFNSLVKTISGVKTSSEPWKIFFSRVSFIAKQSNVTIDRIETGSLKTSISFTGNAPDNTTITNFKTTLSSQSDFLNVILSIPSIHTREDGSIGFQMTFTFIPSESSSGD